MRRFLLSVAMAAGLGLTVMTPAAAQRGRHGNPQLVARLDSAAQRYKAAMPAMPHGGPDFGAIGNTGVDTSGFNVPEMRSGNRFRHVVFGFCVGCTDLNIQVFADGTKLGEDMGPNATPVVEFSTVQRVRVRILTTMAGCGQATCEFGLQIMSANLMPGQAR